jgi:predicted ATPase
MIDHPKLLGAAKTPIHRICLTGGPCAGKTTALATLAQGLTDKGYLVLQVPEAATMLMKGGAMIQTHKLSFSDAVKF